MAIAVAAGQEQISLVQAADNQLASEAYDAIALRMSEHAYMPMLQTAERVAGRYGISREAQDAYALQSQQRTAMVQAAGLFADEIVAVTTCNKIVANESGTVSNEKSRSPFESSLAIADLFTHHFHVHMSIILLVGKA